MSSTPSLYQRRRTPCAQELDGIPWLRLLQPHERDRAVNAIHVTQANPGEYVCMIGRQVTYWFGLIDGLLKMSSENAQGVSMTFAGLPPGGWFGEGTAIKRESYRYNVQALRKSVVAGLHIDTFHWLLDNSLGFNRYIMNQLNERLGQFIGMVENERLLDLNTRVARCLASMFNSHLYPGVDTLVQLSQEEIGLLSGSSRQRANQALQVLEKKGLLRLDYGGIRVLDLDGLRRYEADDAE